MHLAFTPAKLYNGAFLNSTITMTHILPGTVLSLVIVLSGCVTAPPNNPIIGYAKTGGTLEEEVKDRAECRFEAAKATASGNTGTTYALSEAVVHDMVVSQRQKQLIDLCLEARGYHPVYQN